MNKEFPSPCLGESCGECGFRSTVFDCLAVDQLESLSKGKQLFEGKERRGDY